MLFQLYVFLVLLVIYAVPTGITTGAILLVGRKRKMKWLPLEFFYLLLPFLVWLTLLHWRFVAKHDANLFEAFFVGIPGGMILLPRLHLPAETSNRKLLITYISSIVASLIAAGIYFYTPAM